MCEPLGLFFFCLTNNPKPEDVQLMIEKISLMIDDWLIIGGRNEVVIGFSVNHGKLPLV